MSPALARSEPAAVAVVGRPAAPEACPDTRRERVLAVLTDLPCIPSVSADPAPAADARRPRPRCRPAVALGSP